MGKPKKDYTKTINFGRVGSPARILVEMYIKENGNNKLSKLMQELIIIYLSDDPKFKGWKKEKMIFEKKKLGEEIVEKVKQREDLDKRFIKKFGKAEFAKAFYS